jgi:hypothetical protein
MSAFEKLAETLDVSLDMPVTPTEIVSTKKVDKKVKKKEDKEKDFDYVRANLIDLIDKGQELINGAMEVASATEHPRAYEVALNGIKNIADVADKLMDNHKKKNDINKGDDTIPVSQNIQNNVYMTGTTADLLEMINANKKKTLNSDKELK